MAGPAYHARTHVPGGTDPIPFDFGVSPASVPWILAQSSSIVLPPTISGAGFDGSDWQLIPLAGTSPYPVEFDNAVAFTNAADFSTGHHVIKNRERGDLYQAGVFIYKNYSPLTDYGFVSGDKASSIRIAEGFPGLYRITVKVLVAGDTAASQILGVATSVYNMFDSVVMNSASGANHTFGLFPDGVMLDPTAGFGNAAFTDPGSTLFDVVGRVCAEWVGLGMVVDPVDPADIVIRAWNPGPEDIAFDLGVFVEKLDGSGGVFSE